MRVGLKVKVKVKVKFTLEQATKTQILSLTSALDGVGHFIPGKGTRYSLYRELGGSQGRF